MKKLLILFLCFLFVFCSRNKTEPAGINAYKPVYHTWNSLGEMFYYKPVTPVQSEETPPPGFYPWAGIVSHHLLAHVYLDAWFSALSEIRNIECFYILSPDHFGISLQPFSLTLGSWDSGFGLVESDKKNVRRLMELLDAELCSNVFYYEHGVSVLMPYIKKYFPEAKAAVISYNGEHPVNIPAASRLSYAIETVINDNFKNNNFLLISADFSHKGGIELTQRRDEYSRVFLENRANTFWETVYSDNAPAMYLIDRLKNNLNAVIYYHTNSWEIAEMDESDITSYFFVYFADAY